VKRFLAIISWLDQLIVERRCNIGKRNEFMADKIKTILIEYDENNKVY
jgi:hypothetical protein